MKNTANSFETLENLRKSISGTKPDFSKWPVKKDDSKITGKHIGFVSSNEECKNVTFEGIQNLNVKCVMHSGSFCDFSNYDVPEIKTIKKMNFLDIHFIRDKGSHLSPFFLLNQKKEDINKVKYAIFSDIKTNISYPYVEVKEDAKNNKYYDVYFPIINQLKKNADEMEQIRDIIYAFFYHNKIKVIIQKAKYIVKDEKLKEKDSVLAVGLSPIIRFPGLTGSYEKDECRLCYFSTKLNEIDKNEIKMKFQTNTPTEKTQITFYDKNDEDKMKNDAINSGKLNISTILIFDSKSRQMKRFGDTYLPFFDLLYRRIKISVDLYKIFNYIFYFHKNGNNGSDAEKGTFKPNKNICVQKIVSIVDAGQRNSIMDVSNSIANKVFPCFFYDSSPGSSLCSYYQLNEEIGILYFQFRTADRDSILANANAIISSLYTSNVVVFPVSFPPYNFLQSFEYAITRIELLIPDINNTNRILENSKILYLQFPSSVNVKQAIYFSKQFEKLLDDYYLNNMSIKDSKGYNYFIGTEVPDFFKFEIKTKEKKKISLLNYKNRFIDPLATFSVINDYRKYMEMNILLSEGNRSTIIFENEDDPHDSVKDSA